MGSWGSQLAVLRSYVRSYLLRPRVILRVIRVDNYRRNLRVVLCVDIRVVIAQLLYTVTRRIIRGQLRA